MRKYLALLFMLLALFLVGCTTNTLSCDSLEGFERDECHSAQDMCEKVEEVALQDDCFVTRAKVAQEVSLCDHFDETSKTYAYCIHSVAVESSEHALCTTITDEFWSNNCHAALAVKSNEGSFCAPITNPIQQNDCYYDIAQSTSDAQLCLETNEEIKDRCIITIAKDTKDETVCPLLSTELNRQVCILKVAVLQENIDLCESITSKAIKEDCLEKFSS